MEKPLTLFIGTFTTLLAVINPLESLPIYLELLQGQDDQVHRRVARPACLYAALFMFFFLVFGTLTLRIFSVPLSMVRIVGGIILMRIGFSLFLPDQGSGKSLASGVSPDQIENVAFVPLAMPLMFGPGVLATIIGMSSLVQHPFTDAICPGGNFFGHCGDHGGYLLYPGLCQDAAAPHRSSWDRRRPPGSSVFSSRPWGWA